MRKVVTTPALIPALTLALALALALTLALTLTGCGNKEPMEPTTKAVAIDKVDIDLTEMENSLACTTVNQMMQTPDKYEGKKIRMKGTYDSVKMNGTRCDVCQITDAQANCTTGIEFKMAGFVPPEIGAEITVVGAFETYTEEGGSNVYYRLNDAEVS